MAPRIRRFAALAAALGAMAAVPPMVQAQILTTSDEAALRREIPDAAAALDRWLALLDSRNFEGAWDQTSQLFRKEFDRNAWITTLYRLRDQFSPVKRRALLGTTYTRLLRPVSTADAVTFQMVVYLVNETLALETIVFMKEADGIYRVASYTLNRGPVITTPAPLGY